jgi:DNA-binding GntR family transcriptional regulator
MTARDPDILAAPSSPLVHRRKADIAYEYIREQIVNGSYLPGQRMTLAELSGNCGMSHMPVREALVRLQREGLIDGEPHKGVRVAQLSLKDARELFAIRTELEGLAAWTACSSGDPRLARDLETINQAFARAFAAEDFSAMGAANRSFHRRILQAAGSAQLHRVLEDIWTVSLRYRLGYKLIPGRAQCTIDEHAALIAAIRAGDPERARAAAREHIERAGAGLATIVAVPGEK